MPIWLDHLLVLVLAIFFPIRAATFGYRRLALASEDDVEQVRGTLYAQALILQWSLAGVAIALWTWQGRSWMALGVAPQSGVGLWIGLGAFALLALGSWIQQRQARRDPEALLRMLDRVRHVRRMLPHTPDELRRFTWLSITAGICEELLYRGYLLWYLGRWMGPAPALGVSSLIFGIGHSYQGWRGVLTTGVVGAFLGLVYLATGSLVPAMLIHALGDVHSGRLVYAALRLPQPTSAEPEAPEPTRPPDPAAGGAVAASGEEPPPGRPG